jgi:hypothetical protein
MPKAATDVMQAIIFAAVADAFDALKAASKGVPNTMLREIQAVHRNATFADLPKELQEAINASVRSAFTQLLKEGYAVAPSQGHGSRPLDRVPERQRRDPSDRRGPPRGPGGPVRRGGRPPKGGGGGGAGGPGGRPGGRPGGDKPRG